MSDYWSVPPSLYNTTRVRPQDNNTGRARSQKHKVYKIVLARSGTLQVLQVYKIVLARSGTLLVLQVYKSVLARSGTLLIF